MKYFLDTEFIESAAGIQLVSLGIDCENGRTFYAESSMFDERLADDWVKANVLSKLKHWKSGPAGKSLLHTCELDPAINPKHIDVFGSENFIKTCLLDDFLNAATDPEPQFYAYFADYDWVVFARIFGRLIDRPAHFPMWCIDLKQMMWERGLTKEWKREVHPDPQGEHDALVDATWNKGLYKKIIEAAGFGVGNGKYEAAIRNENNLD